MLLSLYVLLVISQALFPLSTDVTGTRELFILVETLVLFWQMFIFEVESVQQFYIFTTQFLTFKNPNS